MRKWGECWGSFGVGKIRLCKGHPAEKGSLTWALSFHKNVAVRTRKNTRVSYRRFYTHVARIFLRGVLFCKAGFLELGGDAKHFPAAVA